MAAVAPAAAAAADIDDSNRGNAQRCVSPKNGNLLPISAAIFVTSGRTYITGMRPSCSPGVSGKVKKAHRGIFKTTGVMTKNIGWGVILPPAGTN